MGYEFTTPVVTYNSIKINNISVSLSDTCRASFTAPYNKIDIEMTPETCSLSYYEVRITQADEDYDIEVGQLAYAQTNIQGGKKHSFSININATNFKYGDGTYRIGLYAKSSLDGSWDVTYLFFTVAGTQFIPSDADGLEVLTNRAAPEIEES